MENFIAKHKYFILVALMIFAASLLFTNLGRADVQHDDATYAFRSLGYLDYMNSQLQTTPVHWFDEAPAWSKLSFHDHPPLTFFVQHIFFKAFGASVFVSRLPSVLAGLLTLLVLFFLVRKLYDDQVALVATIIFSFLTIYVWSNRIAYLEPIALFFILLTTYLFILAQAKEKLWLLFGISFGLTLLTKYTVLFIVPVFLIYLLVYNRRIFLNKYFIGSIILAGIIFSPVVYYNYKMYQTRGHFDLQLSVLLNQDRSDWPGISRDSAGVNFFNNLWRIFKSLFQITSLPMYLLLAVLLFRSILKSLMSRFENHSSNLVLLFLVFALILISLTDPVV